MGVEREGGKREGRGKRGSKSSDALMVFFVSCFFSNKTDFDGKKYEFCGVYIPV